MEFLLANKGTLLFAGGVGLVVFVLMRYWSRRYMNPAVREPIERPLAQRSKLLAAQQPLRDAPAEITRWQVEMQDLARDIKGELDTKIAIFERLVLDARAEADRLEALAQRAETPEPPNSHR